MLKTHDLGEARVRLSPHFSLAEFERTSKPFPNRATAEERRNLERLCREVLEPIRKQFGPLVITSGYRSADVNAAVGGAKFSAHRFGCAADFVAVRGASPTEIVRWIRDHSGLPFDQAIDELNGRGSRWVHIGMLTPASPHRTPRRQALVQRRGSYTPFP